MNDQQRSPVAGGSAPAWQPPVIDDRRPAILVLGYGNELRGDDALGPLAARAIASWGLSDLEARDLHQLTPELAEPIAAAQLVLFIDASQQLPANCPLTAQQLTAGGPPITGHAAGPQNLLRLANQLYGTCPIAYLIAIPASSFDFGAPLSPAAAQSLAEALRLAHDMLTQYRCQQSATTPDT